MNILMLTSVYPSLDDKNENVTKVVRYFVKEWAKQGHTVKVVHNVHKYPSFIHKIPKKIKNIVAGKIGFYIPDITSVSEIRFNDGDVPVWRLPTFKLVPHGGHSPAVIKKQAEKIAAIMETENFTPDIIMGHWISPQIQIISELKKIYNCRTSLVLHGHGYIENKKFNCRQYLPYIDVLGCRSRAESEYVKTALGLEKAPFVCYSGIPDEFVSTYSFSGEKFDETTTQWRFVYAGRLVDYKSIDKVLQALAALKDKDFVFDIIGSGSAEDSLKKLAADLGIADRVVFHGRMPREEVLEYMRKAHCFVMISKGEIFGLVYLEAMAASCIAVGSRDEGIDGVIKDGENGFLSTAADADELAKVLDNIMSKSPEELKTFAQKGFETAARFTDSNVAEWYLADVTENCGKAE